MRCLFVFCLIVTVLLYKTVSWVCFLVHHLSFFLDFCKLIFCDLFCLQCFDTVGWVAGRASGMQKTWVMGSWHGYLSGARCRLAYGPANATGFCFSKILFGFTFLIPAHLDSPSKGAIKCVVCLHLNLNYEIVCYILVFVDNFASSYQRPLFQVPVRCWIALCIHVQYVRTEI